jgi:peptide-methionine (R)-S-oxide reductase
MAEGLFGRGGGRERSSKRTFPVAMTEEEWRRKLTPAQYGVLREHGTERAGSSLLDKEYADGIYHCAGCGQPLFDANAKFNSGTGWPSFWSPLDQAVETQTDRSFFMTRTEVHCSRCGGHLGHVFDDGPQPTGLRYCMNGAALDFHRGETPPEPGATDEESMQRSASLSAPRQQRPARRGFRRDETRARPRSCSSAARSAAGRRRRHGRGDRRSDCNALRCES